MYEVKELSLHLILIKRLFLLVGTAASLALSDPAAGQEKAQSVQPVQLIDVATLEYEPSEEVYDLWREHPGSWGIDFSLTVDQSGKITSCANENPKVSGDLANALCQELGSNARIAILEGFSLGGREGIVGLRKNAFKTIPGFPTTEDQKGPAFSFNLAELGDSAFVDYAPIDPDFVGFEEGKRPELITDSKEFAYPSFAGRAGHSGKTLVLVGVKEDGSVGSCRPVESSGYGRLDNAGCIMLIDKAKYDMREVGQSYSGLRYFTFSFVWSMDKRSGRD